MFCIPCLLKVFLTAIAEPCSKTLCKACHESTAEYADQNLAHDVQFVMWALINACVMVWFYFYYQSTLRSYDYRGLLQDQQNAYESWTVVAMLWMLIFNSYSSAAFVKSHDNPQSGYLVLKLTIVIFVTIGYFVV
jgi:hypothetical protein